MATPKQKSSKAKAVKAAKPAPKKAAVSRPAKPAKKAPVQAKKSAASQKPAKVAAKKPIAKPSPAKKAAPKPSASESKASSVSKRQFQPVPKIQPVELTPFLQRQKQRLLALKDTLLDSMNGVAKDSLRSRAEGSEASAFGMHQADAGSDAYDRDFALSLLSQEQDSLYEIDQALKRLEVGAYGVCEISGKPVPHPRLEALPFTRYTVECQSEIEKRNRYQRVRQPVTSLFGLSDDEGGDGDDDDSSSSSDSKE